MRHGTIPVGVSEVHLDIGRRIRETQIQARSVTSDEGRQLRAVGRQRCSELPDGEWLIGGGRRQKLIVAFGCLRHQQSSCRAWRANAELFLQALMPTNFLPHDATAYPPPSLWPCERRKKPCVSGALEKLSIQKWELEFLRPTLQPVTRRKRLCECSIRAQ